MTSRRCFIAGAAALAAGPTPSRAATVPPPPGRTGYVLIDTGTGATLDARAAGDAFIPASTTKSITTLVTLSTLAPTTRFITRVHATGPLVDGVLQGDLTLVGGGDSALDTADLAQLARALRLKGVRKVLGRFDVTGIDGPVRPVLNAQQPLQAGYNPAIGPLCLNFNRALLRWRNRGGTLDLSTHAYADDHSVPARSVVFRSARGVRTPLHTLSGSRETWTIPAQDLRRDGERWFPVRRPALYAATVFRDLCAEQGILLPAPRETPNTPTGAPLALHQSDVVFAQVKKMMKYSTNLSAEMLGIAAAQRIDGTAATVEDAARATSGWLRREGIVQDDLVLENHSGLSTRSRITPRQMADILRAGDRRFGSGFAGLHTEGKLRGSGTGLPPYSFRTKTGTMHFVRCLAGFIEVEGRRATFAIFSTDDDRRAVLDARYSPYDERRPPGAGRWLRRALDYENAVLRGWIARRLG